VITLFPYVVVFVRCILPYLAMFDFFRNLSLSFCVVSISVSGNYDSKCSRHCFSENLEKRRLFFISLAGKLEQQLELN
jgi:hypothetical protein